MVLGGLAAGALKIRVSGVQFPPWPLVVNRQQTWIAPV
jgi:hypothetical protein